MMKKIVFISLLCTLMVACGEENVEEKGLDITGSWHLTELNVVESRSVTIGHETVDIYMELAANNTFKLYQMVGTGRYRSFAGTWTLEDNTLSGVYNDNTAWGSTYQVTLSDRNTKLILTSKGEEYIYTKESIPSAILSGQK